MHTASSQLARLDTQAWMFAEARTASDCVSRLTLETCKAVCERECNHVGAAAVCERESTCALLDQRCDHVLSVGWGPQTVNGATLSTFFLQGTASWGQGTRWLWRCDRVTQPHFSNPLFSLKELKTKGADQHTLSVGGTGARDRAPRLLDHDPTGCVD